MALIGPTAAAADATVKSTQRKLDGQWVPPYMASGRAGDMPSDGLSDSPGSVTQLTRLSCLCVLVLAGSHQGCEAGQAADVALQLKTSGLSR
jgi:hypothetical protein